MSVFPDTVGYGGFPEADVLAFLLSCFLLEFFELQNFVKQLSSVINLFWKDLMITFLKTCMLFIYLFILNIDSHSKVWGQ